jgi:hypothetical protein
VNAASMLMAAFLLNATSMNFDQRHAVGRRRKRIEPDQRAAKRTATFPQKRSMTVPHACPRADTQFVHAVFFFDSTGRPVLSASRASRHASDAWHVADPRLQSACANHKGITT